MPRIFVALVPILALLPAISAVWCAEVTASATLAELDEGKLENWVVTLDARKRWSLALSGDRAMAITVQWRNGSWGEVVGAPSGDAEPTWRGKVTKYKKDDAGARLALRLNRDDGDASASLEFNFETEDIDREELAGTWEGKMGGEKVEGEFSASAEFSGPLFYGTGAVKTKELTLRWKSLDGKWLPEVGVSASFNQGSHSGSIADRGAATDAFPVELAIGSDNWVEGDDAAGYTLVLEREGNRVHGEFTGTFRGEEVHGELHGSIVGSGWQHVPIVDGLPTPSWNFGDGRRNWNNARWAPYTFASPVDVSDYDGLRVAVAIEEPREDAWADVAIQEHDGSWYYLRDAVPLNREENVAVCDFDRFVVAEFLFNGDGTGPGTEGNFDENKRLDQDRIARIAVGHINPHGIGELSFAISEVRFASWKGEAESPAAVAVGGETLSVNGETRIPSGMFGYHQAGGISGEEHLAELRVGSVRPIRAMAFGGSLVQEPRPELGIDFTVCCQYDRRQVLPNAKSADWRGAAEGAGRKLAEAAKRLGDGFRIEWWNEPYLHMADMIAPGKVRWEDRRKLAGKGARVPDDVEDGDPYVTNFGREFESMEWRVWTDDSGQKWIEPDDPTRFTYWAGTQVALLYSETYNAMARACKEVAPDAHLIAGFGFRWQEDDWGAWDVLYKPMVDRCIPDMTGIHEHHYQGEPIGMAGGYEALQAYVDVKHGKRIDFYNTETNDLWDTPARGAASAAGQGDRFRSLRRMIYNSRDVLYLLHRCPDKAEARAIHALWGGVRDDRVRVGDELGVGKKGRIRLTVDAVEFGASVEHDGESIEAEQGYTFLALEATAENRDKRKRGFGIGQVRVGGGDEPLLCSRVEAVTPGDFHIEGKGPRSLTLVWRVPVERRGDPILWRPHKSGKRVHLSGDFAPFEPPPHRAIGIDKGEYDFGYFFRNLRGRLIAAGSDDDQVWPIASYDEETGQVVVAIWNDRREPREVAVSIAAPEGTTFAGGIRAELIGDEETGATDGTREAQLEVRGKTLEATVTIPPLRALRYELNVVGDLPDGVQVARDQFFAGDPARENAGILHPVAAGETVEVPCPKFPDDASGAGRAWLKLVLERCGDRDGWVEVGGEHYDLPAAQTPFNVSYVRTIPVDPATLDGVDAITFGGRAAEEGGNGYLMCAASLILER